MYDRVVLNPDAISLHCTGRRSKQSSVLRQPRWHPAASIVPIMSLTHTHERSAMIKVNSTVVATNRYLSVDVEITPLVITAAVFDLAIRRLAVMFPTACPINLVIAPPHSVTVWAVSCSPAAVQSGRLAVHAVDKELDLSAVGDLDGFRDPIAAVLSGDTFLTTPIVAFTVPHNIPAPRNRRGGCRAVRVSARESVRAASSIDRCLRKRRWSAQLHKHRRCTLHPRIGKARCKSAG